MSSGEVQRKGRITKAANGRVRWLLVQAAVSILRLKKAETANGPAPDPVPRNAGLVHGLGAHAKRPLPSGARSVRELRVARRVARDFRRAPPSASTQA